MNCSQARQAIPKMLSGLLDDPRELQELMDHIQSCPACQKELELYQAMDAALAGVKMPPELPDRVINHLRSLETGPEFGLWQFVQWATAAAAMVGTAMFLLATHMTEILGLVKFITDVL